jgi:Protein of unknown function (DUF3421)
MSATTKSRSSLFDRSLPLTESSRNYLKFTHKKIMMKNRLKSIVLAIAVFAIVIVNNIGFGSFDSPVERLGQRVDAKPDKVTEAIQQAGQQSPAAISNYQWVPGKNGSVPPGALKAGSDNGEDLYVCRITQPNVSGGVVNGKLHPRFGKCYIAYGKEQEFTTYEVLVGNNLRWLAFGGGFPQNAIVAGSERNGVPLYVCRARLGSGITPGKYHPVNKICYVPYGGKYSDNRYGDILVSGLSEEQIVSVSCTTKAGQVCPNSVVFNVRPLQPRSLIKLTTLSSCSALSYEVTTPNGSISSALVQPGKTAFFSAGLMMNKGSSYPFRISASGDKGACGATGSWSVKVGLDNPGKQVETFDN